MYSTSWLLANFTYQRRINKQDILIDRLCNTLFEKVIIFCLIVIEHTYSIEQIPIRSI